MRLTDRVYVHHDTCNVYLIISGSDAIAIDFGSGAVLDHLADYGVERITDVLMTHHHRDQGQGLARAAGAGARIWVPSSERDLFAKVGTHWQTRTIDNNYDLRQDRFSLLEDVPVHGVVPEYRPVRFGGVTLVALPTPGHTLGSVSYLAELDGRRMAFTGDLLHGPGTVWSVSALQWSYSGLEGAAASVLSLDLLADRDPELILPSHGRPITDPLPALAETRRNLQALVDFRRDEPWDLTARLRQPYEEISPHLLRNRTSFATSYALLSESGAALLIDYGFDMIAGLPTGSDRSSRRPWLASLDALKRSYGIDRIEVAVPTHYHDDHVAGFDLLHEVEGTHIWAADSIAPILRDPFRYDLPCLWYDPLPVDRVVPTGVPVRWHEYELTMWPLPGHTLYAVAIAFQVDGNAVVATGDQQDGGWVDGERTEVLNFQYHNRFRIDDFVDSALLYRRLAPDLMISGHWAPRRVDDAYLDMLLSKGEELARLHRALLPLDEVDFGAEGFGARILPYRSTVTGGEPVQLEVEVRNPFRRRCGLRVDLAVPAGWQVSPGQRAVEVDALGEACVRFDVLPPPGTTQRRARVAANLTAGDRNFGQQAEALVDVR
ncbi:MBL fold metallo-hydrolase [Micromonospora sp. NPDC094482]|uniref:MBL fold metallo-hydrolase n=1 Tax=unclassified Micromonospora TaxID=2617518 RepID=UPI00333285B9